MSWNGSNGENTGDASVMKHSGDGAKKHPSLLRGAFAAIVVVSLAAGVWWVLRDGKDDDGKGDSVTQSTKHIAKKSPTQATPTARSQEASDEKEDKNSLEWLKKHDKRYIVPEDAVRRPNGRLYTKNGRRILEELPARKIYADKDRKIIFYHPAERQVARLLSIEPGKVFVGNGSYGPKFIESFKQSLVQPTLVTKDDDDETRALKRLVNEVKADLKERMDAGEDIVQIMRDTEQELRALAAYRQNLKLDLAALRFDESVSEADYADYVAAANKMLKDRGMKGLSAPVFAEGQLKYLRERHRAIQEQKGNVK